MKRDVALVLSGGSVNGVMMELGFLRRVRESPLWDRVGWIFGTSAGALSGTMAAVDRLDDLERFLLDLQGPDAFRPNRLWRLPLLGTHEYALPQTIDERLGDIRELAATLADSPIELVVCATDVTDTTGGDNPLDSELVYSSRTTEPTTMAEAILASGAVSTLVMPVRVGDRIATDGAWSRNYPLAHAYHRPGVGMIVAFRYLARYAPIDGTPLATIRRRLSRFGRVPPVRALIEELRIAEEREARGEPAHLLDMITRLMRIVVLRNTLLEERAADEKDASIRALAALRADVETLIREHVPASDDRERLVRVVRERFADAQFPFRHDRLVPRITVRAAVADVSLEPRYRTPEMWTEEDKRSLFERGWELTDRELAAAGVDQPKNVAYRR
ncbi:MAG: patatin-like phospholipase family protein [Pseudomonadota bacterium]